MKSMNAVRSECVDTFMQCSNAELNNNHAEGSFPVTDVYFSFGHNQIQHVSTFDFILYAYAFLSAAMSDSFILFYFFQRALNLKKIQSYFECIGEISLIRLHPNPTHTYGFVHFREPEHAAEVLSRTHHKIAGVYVRVKEAERRHKPKMPYATFDNAIDTQTTRAIPVPDLNDDCLREIFDYLNVLDLVSVAKVCPRFEAIAQARFSIKHKTFDFHELYRAARIELHQHHLEGFLERFGQFIVNLRVSYIEIQTIDNDFVLELISKYCKGRLDILKLENFELKGRILKKMRSLFARLQKIYLRGCTFTSPFFRHLGFCNKLKKLKFSDYSECSDCRLFTFNLPELETISFKNFDGFGLNQMVKFLEQNPQLKKVSIVNCESIESSILPEIARRIPLVEKISFKESRDYSSPHFRKNAMHLKQLSSLKKLKIDCADNPVGSVFNEIANAKVPLDYLEIRHCSANRQLVNSISNMNTLKTLNLIQIDTMVASHLHEMCYNLPELTRLVVDKCPDLNTDGLLKLVRKAKKLQEINLLRTTTEINDESFKTLLKIIEKRTESHPLKITVPFSNDSPKRLAKELVNRNRNKLIVESTNTFNYMSDEDDEDDDDDYDSDDLFDSDDYESDYEYDERDEGIDWLVRFLEFFHN